MNSLLADLNNLINPAPSGFNEDPDEVDETAAKVVEKFNERLTDDDDDYQDSQKNLGKLKKRERFLDEEGTRYKGSVVNRSDLFDDADDNLDEEEDESIDDEEDDDEPDVVVMESEEEEEENQEDEDEDNQKKSGKYKNRKPVKVSLPDDETESTELVAPFSRVDLNDELVKARAVQTQLKLWEQLLAARIRLQRVLSLVNQLPQEEYAWQSFSARDETSHLEDARKQLKIILDNLLHLQTQQFAKHSSTKFLVDKRLPSDKTAATSVDNDDDEEILSSPDEEEEEDIDEKKAKKTDEIQKKFYKIFEYPEVLALRHIAFKEFRDKVLLHWYEKTRLAFGKVGGKNDFTGFEKNILKQIEQILSDKSRLIKRTQLKRSSYVILGKRKLVEDTNDIGDEYDAEIFDDDDFYHQLLRELIERKSLTVTDPYALSRQWLEIQKLRNKAKKKQVDRKASKGRKVRYDVLPKLVNFMAPVDRCKFADESKDELFDSLFGKNISEARSM